MSERFEHHGRARRLAYVKAALGLILLIAGVVFGWVGLRHLLWGEPRAAPAAWLFALPLGLLGVSGLRGLGPVLWSVDLGDEGLRFSRLGRSRRVAWSEVVGVEHLPGFTLVPCRLRIRTRRGGGFAVAKSLPEYLRFYGLLTARAGVDSGGMDAGAGEEPVRIDPALPLPDRVGLYWLFCLPVAGLAYGILEPGEGFLLPGFLLGGIGAAVLTGVALFKTRGLVLGPDGFRRTAPLWTTEVAVDDVEEIRLERIAVPLVWNVAIPAFGGRRWALTVDHGYGVFGSSLRVVSGTLDTPVERIWELAARRWDDRGTVSEPWVWKRERDEAS